jgi:hypothetical protein
VRKPSRGDTLAREIDRRASLRDTVRCVGSLCRWRLCLDHVQSDSSVQMGIYLRQVVSKMNRSLPAHSSQFGLC